MRQLRTHIEHTARRMWKPETLGGLSANGLDIYAYCNRCNHSADRAKKTSLHRAGVHSKRGHVGFLIGPVL